MLRQVESTNVTVTFHGPGVPLTINPLHVDLHAGGWVQWKFEAATGELPTGVLMYIHFDSAFGPFQGLSSSGNSVSGKGNSGVLGAHHYTAMVLNESEVVATSCASEALVFNLSAARDTSPHAIVIYDPEEKELGVTPYNLGIQHGETATWHIEGVPQGYFVTFQFPAFPNGMVGPFTTVNLEGNVIPGSSILLASGESYNPGNIASPFKYSIQVRKPDGSLVSSDDPLIDTLGDPPTGPTEEA